ncbi:MAG TPA: HAD-IB family phosphatase [Burkholderiales bacterium]|nr:HAD-IB family phosphatase [Burkholderiales bacterium]
MPNPVLFFDFDNTLTTGDVLDELIAKYSPNDRWREWERAWLEGRLSAKDCLQRQVRNMRVSREELFEHLSSVRLDPAFAEILRWARNRQIEVRIVSDSFLPLILHVLRCNSIEDVPVHANGLAFSGSRLIPYFPEHDPRCTRSANAKARHLAPYRDFTIVFTGDGRSDLDAALASDIVFAKSALARELRERSIPFHPFDTLETVLAWLRASEASRDASRISAV